MKYIHQHDLSGCGIACLANLLEVEYLDVKTEFESQFYKIDKGIKVTDIVRYLATKNLKYKVTHINYKKFSTSEISTLTLQNNSITLLKRGDKYPIGHYLLRVKDGWINPWYNLPSINNVHAGLRPKLPDKPMYVIAPIF